MEQKMFKYQKEKDAGDNIELEDLSVTDNEIYKEKQAEDDSGEAEDSV